MEDIELLPKDMMSRSLSEKEIVLNYEDALKTLDIFLEKDWAFLGWEGWGKYTDGGVGHCDYQGTVSIELEENESWQDYGKRGYDFVKETIIEDYNDWKKSDSVKKYELYFCISAISKDGLKKLSAKS